MCGIVGGVWISGVPTTGDFSRALDALEHRGPDGRGTERLSMSDAEVLLGQTRLAVIDLSPGGRQPMCFADERYWIAFNGEIYNYLELRRELEGQGVRFKSQSDTEVLLAAWAQWGEAAIARLRGMFAFTVLDTQRAELVCVRDAFGIKPFYFGCTPEVWAFASEPGVVADLLGTGRAINEQRLYEYLVTGAPDRSRSTAFEGVLALPPGHVLRVRMSDGRLEQDEWRWWLPDLHERRMSRLEAVEEVRETFLQNIRLHLRSDVPLAVALSGGLDSSAIACGVRAVVGNSDIHTFSYHSEDATLNEASWISSVNRRIGGISHDVVIENGDLARDIDDVIVSLGEPFGSTSIYAQYRVYKAARDQGFTVMLDGQGADEMFAGYLGYPDFRMLSHLRRGELLRLTRFLHSWGDAPGRSRLEALRGLVAATVGESPRAFLGPIVEARQSPPWIDGRYARERGLRARALPRAPIEWVRGRDLVSRLFQTMTDGELATLLRHGDRNSMRWSVESRTPFLTTNLAELALSMPEAFLVDSHGMTKAILRDAMSGLVPEDVLRRRDKIGFGTPQSAWLRHLAPQLPQWLDDLQLLPMIDRPIASSMVMSACEGKAPLSGDLWRILCATRWARLVATN